MTDLAQTIAPKSDQLNADDLIAGPRTIVVTRVAAPGGDQPISIYFEGDNDKPYKPGKSMRRVLVQLWGSDGSAYVGRAMTLYRDPNIRFGGDIVGGIRISHMSDIDGTKTLPLTVTRGQRKPYTVKPLKRESANQTSGASSLTTAEKPPAGRQQQDGGARPAAPPSDTFPGDFIAYGGAKFDPARPCPLDPPCAIEDMEAGEQTAFATALAALMKAAAHGDTRRAWFNQHQPEILQLKARRPNLVRRLEELRDELPASPGERDGAPLEGAGASSGAPSQREAR